MSPDRGSGATGSAEDPGLDPVLAALAAPLTDGTLRIDPDTRRLTVFIRVGLALGAFLAIGAIVEGGFVDVPGAMPWAALFASLLLADRLVARGRVQAGVWIVAGVILVLGLLSVARYEATRAMIPTTPLVAVLFGAAWLDRRSFGLLVGLAMAAVAAGIAIAAWVPLPPPPATPIPEVVLTTIVLLVTSAFALLMIAAHRGQLLAIVAGQDRALARIVASEALHRAILDAGEIGVIVLDPIQLEVRYASDHAARLLGQKPEDLHRRRLEEFVGPAGPGETFAGLTALAPRGRIALETSLRRPDGSVVELLATFTGATGPRVDDGAVVGTLLDIGPIREARLWADRIGQANAVAALAGTIAHEMNNQLTVIGGALDLIAEADVPESLRSTLADARMVAEEAGLTSRSLVRIAEAGAGAPSTVPVDELLGELVPGLVDELGMGMAVELRAGAAGRWSGTSRQALAEVLGAILEEIRDARSEGPVVIETRAGAGDGTRRGDVTIIVHEACATIARPPSGDVFVPRVSESDGRMRARIRLVLAVSLIGAIGGTLSVEATSEGGRRWGIVVPGGSPPSGETRSTGTGHEPEVPVPPHPIA